MATANVKRESYFLRFRNRWKRRGVIEIDEDHPKHHFTMCVRQGLQDSLATTSELETPACMDEATCSEEFRKTMTPTGCNASDFHFVTYAPRVFASLRNQVGMTPEIFGECICPAEIETKYLEFVSNSKSGQNFFLSNDKQLMIKTHTSSEKHFFLAILPKYIEHLKRYPHTLLVRYLGLYKIVVFNGDDPVYFVVMKSILYPDERITLRFDLKACEAGRYTEDQSESNEVITVLKDKNFDERKINLGSQSSWFTHQIQHDTEFLQRLRVIDYSLLIGIQPLHSEEIKGNQELASVVVRAQKSLSRERSVLRRWTSPTTVMNAISEDGTSTLLNSSGETTEMQLPGAIVQDSEEKPTTDGAAPSTSNATSPPHGTSPDRPPDGSKEPGTSRSTVTESESFTQNRRLLPECRNELHVIDGSNGERYFIGIIDFFTPYGMKKRCESLYKTMKYKASGLSFSTVNPNAYARRFREFVTNHVE